MHVWFLWKQRDDKLLFPVSLFITWRIIITETKYRCNGSCNLLWTISFATLLEGCGFLVFVRQFLMPLKIKISCMCRFLMLLETIFYVRLFDVFLCFFCITCTWSRPQHSSPWKPDQSSLFIVCLYFIVYILSFIFCL